MNSNNESLKRILKKYNLKAKKRFGQNFLHDKNIINQIVKSSSCDERFIVEVGPGPGLLTNAILEKKIKKVLAIETDKTFLPILEELKEKHPKKFEFIINDALKVDLDKLISEKYSVISNLPYNISVPFIISLLIKEQPVKWEKLTLTVQKEVADRMMAKINTKQYGRLSVLTQWRCKIKKICEIKPSCFIPPPKVISTVISIEPKNNILTPSVENFQKIVSYAFGFRRKTLKKSLSKLEIDINKLADFCEIDLSLRAQNLSVDDYINLTIGYEKFLK
jgi:16S rRNA (adenine1518-N6/adenine1519-N6)-dimethyltransferase|tara:strand:- start:5523 stop:6356 length:834 start_codon:yes stop_codon:yes gene_type:complete